MEFSADTKSNLKSKILIGFIAPLAFMLSSVSVLADQQTADAQSLLNNLGYNAGSVDGIWLSNPCFHVRGPWNWAIASSRGASCVLRRPAQSSFFQIL